MFRKSALFALLAAALVSAAAFVFTKNLVPAAGAFPLCMYGVNRPQDVPLIKKAGFTCLQTYRTNPAELAALAKAARKNGLKVLFRPEGVIGSAYEKEARNWPVLAWYLVDEPDVNRWTRERVERVREKNRQAFPNHPTALVIGQGKTATPFYDLTDILMVDWYPVPHLELRSFGDNVRWAKEGQAAYGAGARPLWGVAQAFDWKEFPQNRSDDDRIGRFPAQEEIRFMSYDGIVNGADGLFYFIFTTKAEDGTPRPLPEVRPAWWARVSAVSREIAALRPVLEKGKIIPAPVPTAFPLTAQTRVYKNKRYTILINRADQPVAVPQAFLSRTYKMRYGPEKTALIAPHGVWVMTSKNK